ncbi:MAG: chemotaxis protein CheA [Planctomycetota bacterium]
MSTTDFDPEILQDFLTESGELLDELETELVSLEATPDDPDLINLVFRALHTIKGSASFLALTNLVAIAHASESALNAARNGQAVVDGGLMDLLLKAVDVLKIQFEELGEGSTDLTPADQPLIDRLAAIGEGRQNEADGDAPSDAEASSSDDASTPDAGGFTLPPEKEDLLEHFVSDVERQLDALTEHVGHLATEAERGAAGPEMTDIAEDLAATVDFFEFDPMLPVVKAIGEAAGAVASIADDAAEALGVGLGEVLGVMREQTSALKERRAPTLDAEALLTKLSAISRGEVPPEDDGQDTPASDPPAEPADEAAVGAASALSTAPEPTAVPDTRPASPAAAPAAAQAAPQKAKEPARGGQGGAAEQTIRVEVSRLESLMNLVGELVLQKNRIGELAHRVAMQPGMDAELGEQIELAGGGLDRVTGEIQLAVMKTRMQPLDKLFGKYPRLIRDLSQKTGKKIALDVIGGETEVDKSVIEELGDPLVHLIRNSADHGLEPPEERIASGKSDTGTITLRAAQAGDHVVIEIIDDGRGLNRDKIAEKAVERGIVRDVDVANLSDDEVAKLIFLPGFSTADEVSDLSGRGVGMDVVRTNIENLKGSISVSTERGKGSRFTVTIPLTVAIMPAMMVAVQKEQYAIPLGSIVEIVRPEAAELTTILKERVIRLRDGVMPLMDAHELFGVIRPEEGPSPLAVVLSDGDAEMGLLVTSVIGQQEVVIKPLDGVESHGPVSGATVRNDGGVSLIMDVAELLRRTGGRG